MAEPRIHKRTFEHDMSNFLKIGLIGLDTSHVLAFTRLLNDETAPFHVAGGRVVAAFAGGSPDFALSRDRVEGFSRELVDDYRVQILESPAAVAEHCDALMLTSVDGRVHLSQLSEIASLGKPTFIDKPFAVDSNEAQQMVELAAQHKMPLMGCSGLRYAQPLVDALSEMADAGEAVVGVDCYGPMQLEATQPGLFWYGIHCVEMVYAALGCGCQSVSVVSNQDFDIVTAQWRDGRLATIRGNRLGNNAFGATLHGAKTSRAVAASAHPKPTYAALLPHIMTLFRTGVSPIPIEETLEIVRFIEAANKSRGSGAVVKL